MISIQKPSPFLILDWDACRDVECKDNTPMTLGLSSLFYEVHVHAIIVDTLPRVLLNFSNIFVRYMKIPMEPNACKKTFFINDS